MVQQSRVDAIDLHSDLISNGSFEPGVGGWSTSPGTNFTTIPASGANTQAYEGNDYGATNTGTPGGSIYQDIPASISAGQSYCASMEAVTDGTATGGGGVLSLWLLGGGGNENSTFSFSNLPGGDSWTPGSTCMTATTSHTSVEVQFYPDVNGPTVAVDAVDTQAKGYGVSYAAPSVATGSLSSATVGIPYSASLEETGGAGPLTWSLSSGSLPQGMTLAQSGLISGTPTGTCNCTFTVEVTDSSVKPMSASQQLTLFVGQPPTITSAPNATFIEGAPSSFTPTATGYPIPIISEDGALPSGVTYTSAGISGTPTERGTFPITLTAHNGVGTAFAQSFTLTVVPLGITTTSLPAGTVKTPYTATLAASGGNPPYKWKLATGSKLPKGLKLSSAGQITGTPKAAGTTTVTIQVTDTKTKSKPPSSTWSRPPSRSPSPRRITVDTMLRRRAVGVLAAVLLGVTAMAVPVAIAVVPASPAGAVAPGACGSVLVSGGSWLGGGGVDVHSNGSDEGTGVSCGGNNYVNGVFSGTQWQCVELVNRLYLSKGWISSTWSGDGDQLFNTAPSNLSKQANGSVSYLGPGDVISINVYDNGSLEAGGHTLIVNDSSNQSSGTVPLVSQNAGDPSNATPTGSATISGGAVTVLGGGGGWSYSVIGVIHAPSGGGGPPPTANGGSAIVSPYSGGCVDVPGASTTPQGRNSRCSPATDSRDSSGFSRRTALSRSMRTTAWT